MSKLPILNAKVTPLHNVHYVIFITIIRVSKHRKVLLFQISEGDELR